MAYDNNTGITWPMFQRELTSYFGDPRERAYQTEYMDMINLSEYGVPSLNSIYANWIIEGPLRVALDAMRDKGLLDTIHSFDGCYNPRPMKSNSRVLSVHAWGLAIDLNASTNPFGRTLVTDFSDEFIQCMALGGFEWGGLWNSVKDAMHFQLPWTRDWRGSGNPLAPKVYGE